MSPLQDSSVILHTVLAKSFQRCINSYIRETIKLPDKMEYLHSKRRKIIQLGWRSKMKAERGKILLQSGIKMKNQNNISIVKLKPALKLG